MAWIDKTILKIQCGMLTAETFFLELKIFVGAIRNVYAQRRRFAPASAGPCPSLCRLLLPSPPASARPLPSRATPLPGERQFRRRVRQSRRAPSLCPEEFRQIP